MKLESLKSVNTLTDKEMGKLYGGCCDPGDNCNATGGGTINGHRYTSDCHHRHYHDNGVINDYYEYYWVDGNSNGLSLTKFSVPDNLSMTQFRHA